MIRGRGPGSRRRLQVVSTSCLLDIRAVEMDDRGEGPTSGTRRTLRPRSEQTGRHRLGTGATEDLEIGRSDLRVAHLSLAAGAPPCETRGSGRLRQDRASIDLRQRAMNQGDADRETIGMGPDEGLPRRRNPSRWRATVWTGVRSPACRDCADYQVHDAECIFTLAQQGATAVGQRVTFAKTTGVATRP